MTRLSSYDIDKKKAGDVVKCCVEDLSKYCKDIYFLQIGEVDDSFLSWLNVNKIITKSSKNYSEGWVFDNNLSLTDLYLTVDKKYKWVLYPDMDDLLPPQILEEVDKADKLGYDVIDTPMLECLDGINRVICDFKDYVIGPHAKALKMADDITFIGTDGFAKPISKKGRKLRIYNCSYPTRHLRYMNKNLIEERKKINFYQDFFERTHKITNYNPNWRFNDYINYGFTI